MKIKKQKSLFKIIILSFFSLIGIVIFYILLSFIIFQLYKDDISKKILLSVNKEINGKISFGEVSFTPFRFFPNASLILNDFSLSESKDSVLNAGTLPVFDIGEVYISINIVDLFSSKINASSITLENGNINIIVYPDSQINLKKAISGTTKKEKVQQKQEPIDTNTHKVQTESKTDISFQFTNLELTNIEVIAENQFKKNKIQLKINDLQSDLYYSEKRITSSVSIDCKIDTLIKNNEILFSSVNLNLDTELKIDTDSLFVKFDNGSCSVDEAKFNFNGIFDSKMEGLIDLSVSGSDEDFSLFSLFLSKEGMNDLKSGNLFFDTSINGKTFIEFPQIKSSFGLKDVELINPITKRKISDLNLKGRFSSGQMEDWSQAKLSIDTLFADMPDGSVNFSGTVNNLKFPEVEANIFLSADVTGLEKVFKLNSISDLTGNIEIIDYVKGRYNIEEKTFINEVNNAKISFEDFGIKVPGVILFDKINGVIESYDANIRFEDLKIISEDTDILINGEIKNAMAIMFNREDEIIGNLQIKSNVFDLPNFLFFDPYIKRDFNHRILNADVDVVAKTTTSKATKFKSFPEIEFDIKKIDAVVEGFLPRLEIKSGVFKVSENILGFNLMFTKFKTNFLNGNFNFTGEYNTSKFQPYYIKAKADCDDIRLSELFFAKNDTIPEILDGKLSGSFFAELQFPVDSLILKYIKFNDSDFLYKFSKDTITARNFNFSLNNIYFNEHLNSNPLATMFASGILQSKTIQSRSFKFNDIDVSINISNGRYEIKSDVVRLFGENAQGKSVLTMTPFSTNPSYQLSLKDVRFNAEKLLEVFNEDSVFKGPVNLSLSLNSSGSDWKKVVENIDGTINLSGEHLSVNGLDADEIIDKFKRSQSFNLVDLGAVLLAGPVGIAVTKGTDFARIFVFNSGKFTLINKLVSNWTIKNGTFKIIDAAFSTNKNRIALTGSIAFADNNLNLVIALLNKNGCSIFSQNVYGDLNSPQLGKVKVVGTVLAPVTNLVDDVTGKDCVVFYQGVVEHPK